MRKQLSSLKVCCLFPERELGGGGRFHRKEGGKSSSLSKFVARGGRSLHESYVDDSFVRIQVQE